MACEGPHCQGCPQQASGVRRLGSDGRGSNGVMILGDSPWMEEMVKGHPFAGASGHLLNRAFDLLGVAREDFIIANAAISCRPPHLGWTDNTRKYPEAAIAMEHCRPYTADLIARMRPKVIVTLGNTALSCVCGVSGLDQRHSYIHSSPYGIPVIPTYHPSFILQGNQKYMSVLLFALRRALDIAEGRFTATEYDLLLDPPIEVATSYLSHAATAPEVICDIETPHSSQVDEEEAEEDPSYTIVRVSFSIPQPGAVRASAITFPWQPPYISAALSCLREARELVFWNQSFDVPRLLASGATFRGTVVDAMYSWHFLQSDLPKALGFVAPFYYSGGPWKHLSGAQPPFYSATDAAITRSCYEGIKNDLIAQGRWDAFTRHCTRVAPILTRMGGKGIAVDVGQQTAFMKRMEVEYQMADAVLQESVPTGLKLRKRWKRAPKDMTGVIELT